MDDKNKYSTYKTHYNPNKEVSFCVKVKNNALSPMINSNGKKRSKPSEVSPREEVQTSYIVYNTEGYMSSEDLHHLYNVI